MTRGDGPPKREGIQVNIGPVLAYFAPNMPPVSIVVAKVMQIRLSQDGSHICVPICLSTNTPQFRPWKIMQMPISEVIDMAIFKKFAAFIAQVLMST